MKFRDHYEALGISRTASAEEIKRAYRRLARKYHPDVSKEPDAEARFMAMKEAYEVLRDPETRAAYDRFGADWQAAQGFEPPPGADREFAFSGGHFEDGHGFDDLFESLFSGRAGGRYGSGHQPFDEFRMAGEDVNARISIPLEDAYRGATRQLTLELPDRDASGRAQRTRRTLKVKIPRGITAGQRIRLEDQGHAGRGRGARAGDLYLSVDFEPHPVFEARGKDVYCKLPVAPWEAALGRTVKAPTLGGQVDLTIPPGSSSGRQLRLKGRGLPGKPAGDQYVELLVTLPHDTSARARRLYEQLEREQSFDPRAGLGI